MLAMQIPQIATTLLVFSPLLVVSTTAFFSSNGPRSHVNVAPPSRLDMGGYYADPEVPLDQSNTHMIFGQRCLETKISVPVGDEETTTNLVWLQPTQEEEPSSPSGNGVRVEVDHGPPLIEYLGQTMTNLQGRSVLEVGASSASLAALVMGAASVVVCHPEAERLRIMDHAIQFLNPALKQSMARLQTVVLKPEDSLPKADIVIFTMAGLNRLDEALDKSAGNNKDESALMVLVPISIIPPTQLQNYRYKDSSNGVVQVIAPKS